MPGAEGEIAVTWVSVLPDTSKIGPDIKKAMGEVQRGADGAEKQGGGIGAALGKGLKRTFQAGLAGGALFAGISLTKGLSRLLQIDDARASLSGLGHDVKGIDKIMGNALASVRGTAFGLGDAGTVAASSVAAGIKPGEALTRTLKLTADAATIAKTDMGSMGAIFNKVASSNKIQGDTIAQLNDAGIPIVQLMAKELGTTAEETTELARKGKIDFATFQNALEAGLGGAALKSGNTARGAFANVGAALSRIGAGLLGGTFPHLAPAFQGITDALSPLEGGAESVGNKIGKVLGPALENIGPWITRMVDKLRSFDFGALADKFRSLGDGSTQAGAAFRDIGDSLKGIDFTKVREAFGQGAADTVSVFSVVIGFLADHIDKLAAALPFLIAGFVAYKTVQALNNIIGLAGIPIQGAMAAALFLNARASNRLATQMAIQNNVERQGMVQRSRATVGLVASKVATLASAVATRTAAAAQRLLNLAMRANPIGILITGLTALVGGLIYVFTRTEWGRKVWDTVWTAIKTGLGAAWAFISPILSRIGTWLGSILPAAFNVFKTIAGVAFTVIGAHVKAWWAIVSTIFNAVRSFISGALAPAFMWLYNGIVRPVFGWIGQRVSNVWNHIIKPVFGALRGGVGKIADAFSATKDGIKKAWDKLGGIVQTPIDKAIGIINGFLGLIDKIPGVDLKFRIGGGGKETGNAPGKRSSGRAAFRAGGAVFGRGTSTSDSIEARLSNNEHVWTAKEVAQAGGHKVMYAWRAAVARGKGIFDGPLAFAKGGAVVPGRGNQHSKTQYPSATWAGDFPVGMGTPVHAWKSGVVALVRSLTTSYGKHMRFNHDDGTSSLVAHLSRFAASVGDRVRQGQVVGYSGSTGNSTGPHVHAEFMGGSFAGAGGALLSKVQSVWDTLKGTGSKITDWIKSKLLDKANIGGLFGNVSGLFSNIGNGVKKHVTDKLFDSGGLAGGTGLMAKNTIAPERVLSPRQTAAFERAMAGGFGGQSSRPIAVDGKTFAYLVEDMARESAEIVFAEYSGLDGQLTNQGV